MYNVHETPSPAGPVESSSGGGQEEEEEGQTEGQEPGGWLRWRPAAVYYCQMLTAECPWCDSICRWTGSWPPSSWPAPRPPSPPGWCRCAGTPGTTPSPAETSTPVSPKTRGSLQQPLLQVLVHVSLLSLVQPYAEIASIVAIETFLLVQYLNCVLY